ncbi:Uncharacterised protein [uncultured archaeon]|nr:Uncharacterised protein [uncultured archaeon]
MLSAEMARFQLKNPRFSVLVQFEPLVDNTTNRIPRSSIFLAAFKSLPMTNPQKGHV